MVIPSKGSWAIFGKVVVANTEGHSQNAQAKLTARDGSVILDQADFRVPGDASQRVARRR
jgi:hypothetical protein